MKIGPLFRWFGSKWLSAKHYPYPEHDAVVEPYAGGAGYSLNYCHKAVTIYDTDPNLSVLWPWIIQATAQDVRDIPVDLPVGTDIRTIGLSEGQALLMKHWQRTNSVGDCWTVSSWNGKPGMWSVNTRARVAEQITAVRHWRFQKPDLSQVATWFIDPPYEFNYRYRAGLAPFSHAALAADVEAIAPESHVIVCEAVGKNGETPSYLPFLPSHLSVTSRRKATQSHHSRELVYLRP